MNTAENTAANHHPESDPARGRAAELLEYPPSLSQGGTVGATPWVHDDGGRAGAGYRGETGDCVTRAIAIATGLPYQHVYRMINDAAARERPRNGRNRSSARTGVAPATARRVLAELCWVWHPTMRVGQGCTVHLREGELPSGRIIARLSRHITAVVDGVVHDIFDPARGGTRCVYGYWTKGDRAQ